MSTYDDDLIIELNIGMGVDCLKIIGESDDIFLSLERVFPLVGSKIDWENVPNSIEDHEVIEELHVEKFIEFFDKICMKFNLMDSVIYVGDNVTSFALEGDINIMRKYLGNLIEIPQHHYFIEKNYEWCMSMTMEGDMAFGFSDCSSRIENQQ